MYELLPKYMQGKERWLNLWEYWNVEYSIYKKMLVSKNNQ
jgi:hypothetical protein